MAERTVSELTNNCGNWTRFLDTAGRLYKYPFSDQLMIYAQRPDAVACAELELWNERFNRWVRRGSTGIALIDDTGEWPRLKYVFDIADTEPSRYNARPVKLWEMRQDHRDAVLAELEKSYEGVDGTLAESFHNIARQLATEYYSDNTRDIHYRAEDSYLESHTAFFDGTGSSMERADDGVLQDIFVDTLSNSIAYTLMSRCGFDTSEYFEDGDFKFVTDFNTPDMVYALGRATSELSEQVLRDIETVIKKHERVRAAQVEHTTERSVKDHEYDRNPYLHPSRGLSASEHHDERAAGDGRTVGQVRPNEENVPERSQANQLQPPAAHGEAVSAPAGSGRGGEQAARTGNDRADGTEQPARQGGRRVLPGFSA